MKELEQEKKRAQQEKIDRLRDLSEDEREWLNREGGKEVERILARFAKKKPPRGRQG